MHFTVYQPELYDIYTTIINDYCRKMISVMMIYMIFFKSIEWFMPTVKWDLRIEILLKCFIRIINGRRSMVIVSESFDIQFRRCSS